MSPLFIPDDLESDGVDTPPPSSPVDFKSNSDIDVLSPDLTAAAPFHHMPSDDDDIMNVGHRRRERKHKERKYREFYKGYDIRHGRRRKDGDAEWYKEYRAKHAHLSWFQEMEAKSALEQKKHPNISYEQTAAKASYKLKDGDQKRKRGLKLVKKFKDLKELDFKHAGKSDVSDKDETEFNYSKGYAEKLRGPALLRLLAQVAGDEHKKRPEQKTALSKQIAGLAAAVLWEIKSPQKTADNRDFIGFTDDDFDNIVHVVQGKMAPYIFVIKHAASILNVKFGIKADSAEMRHLMFNADSNDYDQVMSFKQLNTYLLLYFLRHSAHDFNTIMIYVTERLNGINTASYKTILQLLISVFASYYGGWSFMPMALSYEEEKKMISDLADTGIFKPHVFKEIILDEVDEFIKKRRTAARAEAWSYLVDIGLETAMFDLLRGGITEDEMLVTIQHPDLDKDSDDQPKSALSKKPTAASREKQKKRVRFEEQHGSNKKAKR